MWWHHVMDIPMFSQSKRFNRIQRRFKNLLRAQDPKTWFKNLLRVRLIDRKLCWEKSNLIIIHDWRGRKINFSVCVRQVGQGQHHRYHLNLPRGIIATLQMHHSGSRLQNVIRHHLIRHDLHARLYIIGRNFLRIHRRILHVHNYFSSFRRFSRSFFVLL